MKKLRGNKAKLLLCDDPKIKKIYPKVLALAIHFELTGKALPIFRIPVV